MMKFGEQLQKEAEKLVGIYVPNIEPFLSSDLPRCLDDID
jgi:hypothetical protein